jgi:FAD/FMN-containing dehydrogenase
MNRSAGDLWHDSAASLPPGRVLRDGRELAALETDGLFAICALLGGVVYVQDEVVTAVRWCARHRVPLSGRGSGTRSNCWPNRTGTKRDEGR